MRREKRRDQPGIPHNLIPGARNAESQSATRSVHGILSSLTSLEAPPPRHPHCQERPGQATWCSTLYSGGDLLAGFPMDMRPHKEMSGECISIMLMVIGGCCKRVFPVPCTFLSKAPDWLVRHRCYIGSGISVETSSTK